MFRNFSKRFFLCVLAISLIDGMTTFGQDARDLVSGNLIQFNNNGAWCWYQDERAVVDSIAGNLILGSVASNSGTGGSRRAGSIEATIFDLHTGALQRNVLMVASYTDDHHAPGFLVRADGKILTMYAQHYDAYFSRYQIFDGSAWSGEKRFDWMTIPGRTDFTIAYSNLYYLSSENRVYNFARANHRAPNFIFSDDMGDTWSFGGQITTNSSDTYTKGYYKYWGNGIDRIDFIFTEQHPRDTMTSIYHGYIKGGKSYASDGTVADENIYGMDPMPTFRQFTKVFSDGTLIGGVPMKRCWNTDVMRYDDGTIVTIITARTNNYVYGGGNSTNPDHAFIYCRYDGSAWSYTYLGKAGLKMYASEQDYTGLAAVCPDDPNTIYISTTYDPRDNTTLNVHEIFKGVTSDHGATWSWTPVTQKSVCDNFRPIVPAWDKNNTALLWWRGTYTNAQSYNAAVVGILDRRLETTGLKTYVDASSSNTFLADGMLPLAATGPDSNKGAKDNQWHQRTGYGNGGSVLTSSEIEGENAPVLKTQLTVSMTGTYDVWVNFWANPTADWRIKAGLSRDGMQVFRQMACKQVESGDYNSPIIRTGDGYTFLYQAYLGRIVVPADDAFDVFVDDEAVRTGTSGTLQGDVARTWYDGVSFARISTTTGVSEKRELPIAFRLEQNHPNPFNPTTTISYSLFKSDFVALKVFDALGREVRTLVNGVQPKNDYRVTLNATGLESGIYFYRLTVGRDISETRKMLFMK